jgi:AcrR family transcriptional regulator
VQRTRGHVLAVARELLAEAGPAGLTYSALAARARVTRQTLYRHWPSRAALLVDLVLEGPEVGYPEPGDDVGVVAREWLTSVRAGLAQPAARAAVLAVTSVSESDPDSALALVRIGADRLAAFNELLMPTGRQVSPDEYTMLYGPVLSRIFFDRAEVNDQFIEAVVAQWVAGLA